MTSVATHDSRQTTGTPGTRLPLRWRYAPLLVAGVLLALGWWLQAGVERSIRSRLEQNLTTVLDANVTAIEVWLETQAVAAQALAANQEVSRCALRMTEMTANGGVSHAELVGCEAAGRLSGIVGAQIHAHGFDGYAVFGPDGTGLAATHALLVGAAVPDVLRPFVERAFAGETRISPPFLSPLPLEDGGDHEPLAIVATPVTDEDGRVQAALLLRLRPERDFSRLLTVSRFGETGETYAFDGRGRMLSPSRFEDELLDLGLLAPGESSMLVLDLRDPGVDLGRGRSSRLPRAEQPLTVPVAAALEGRAGVDVDGHRDYRGVQVVGAWTWLPDYDFGVATEVSHAEACRPLHVLRRTLFSIFGLLVVAYLGLLFTSRSALLNRRRLQRAIRDAQRLGQYVLEEQIGEGGMGAVYRASHVLLRRPTALKLLLPEKNSPQDIQRFEREVQLTSSLTHPNTVAVFDYGHTPDGIFYYAMEYLPGVHLKELVQRFGPVPEGRAIQILAQVCDSLAEAHAKGMVHRDIKPSNLMLCERGGIYDVVKVLDFGLVKQLQGEDQLKLTAEDAVAGTPQYLPPELAGPAGIDARSDLYSLGCVAYFLLTGTDVFRADNVIGVVAQHVTAEPQSLSERLGRPISADLEAVVLACLAKAPADRPQSAGELQERLAHCQQAGCWTQEDARAWWQEHESELQSGGAVVRDGETRSFVVEIDRRRAP